MLHPDSGVAIAYNGEVYNAPEIREELVRRGHRFRTTTDTEVVLIAFVEFGADCAAMFEGMFAYAIWDPCDSTLHVARDRMGEKPLYYVRLSDGATLIASEIKALLAAGFRPSVDSAAIDHYLEWKYTRTDSTIYREVEIVPAAHTMVFDRGSVIRKRFWSLPPSDAAGAIGEGEALDQLNDLLQASVRKRLQSDRKIGLFLSGGVDSTILGAMAAAQSPERLAGFTVAYGADLDESRRAAAAAAQFGIDHTILPIRAFSPADLEEVCSYLDQPHADSANIAHALLSRCASEHVPVILAGDGADELFCGYRWYQANFSLAERQARMNIFEAEQRRKLLGAQAAAAEQQWTGADDFDALNRFDLTHYLGGQLLPKADMLSMKHGVELRTPFLDFRLIEFARSLPEKMKVSVEGKPLLRLLHGRLLPDRPALKRKQGFGAPLFQYLSAPGFLDYAQERLDKGARIRTLFDETELERLVRSLLQDLRGKNAYRLWVLLCLELWAESVQNRQV